MDTTPTTPTTPTPPTAPMPTTQRVRGLAVWARACRGDSARVRELAAAVLGAPGWTPAHDALLEALASEVRDLERATRACFRVELRDGHWSVVDGAGGRWLPTVALDADADPGGLATLLSCWRNPPAGLWHY
jgi:hypothetical protein